MSHSRTLNELACPPIQIFATDIEDLYVTQDPLAGHLLEVDALNVEEDRMLSQLVGRLAGKRVFSET